MTDDLVGVHCVLQRPGGGALGVTVIQRRARAMEIAATIEGAELKQLFLDIVGNPVVIDCSAVLDVLFVQVTHGKPLFDALSPIPTDCDLAAVCPEALAMPPTRPKADAESTRRPTAADEDPIEAAERAGWRTRN